MPQLDQFTYFIKLFWQYPFICTFIGFHFFFFILIYLFHISTISKTTRRHNQLLGLLPRSNPGWFGVHVVSEYPPDWEPPKEKQILRVELINPAIDLLKVFLLSSLAEVFFLFSFGLFNDIFFVKNMPLFFTFFFFYMILLLYFYNGLETLNWLSESFNQIAGAGFMVEFLFHPLDTNLGPKFPADRKKEVVLIVRKKEE